MNLFNYIKSVQAELKEVRWPTREQTITYTLLIVFVGVILGIFLGAIDLGLKEALVRLIN